jgi:hypothetical protein
LHYHPESPPYLNSKHEAQVLSALYFYCSFHRRLRKDEEPAKNQSVVLFNNSDERIAVAYIGFDDDSTKPIAEIRGTATSPLVRFTENDLIIEPLETREIHSFSDETLKRSLDQAGDLSTMC